MIDTDVVSITMLANFLVPEPERIDPVLAVPAMIVVVHGAYLPPTLAHHPSFLSKDARDGQVFPICVKVYILLRQEKFVLSVLEIQFHFF